MKKLFFFIVIFISLFINSYSREFTEPDELKYVEISREMLEKSSYFMPIYNYDFYFDKGPIYFYILIFFQKIFGENRFSAIFPSQIFSLLILFIFYKILKLFEIDEEEIFLSILIIFSSIQFFFLSKAVRMDIVLSFFVIISYYLLLLKLIRNKKGFEIFYGLFFSLSILTKGPVSFIWFWAVPFFYGLLEKDRRVIKFIFHPLNLIFSFLPVVIWTFLAFNQTGPILFEEIFHKQTFERIHSSFAHQRPIFYYFYMLPLSFFPYTFFLPFSFYKFKKFNGYKFFLSVFLIPFTIFSLISGKISIYLLPLSFSISIFISKFLLSDKDKIKKILAGFSIIFIISGFFVFKYYSTYAVDKTYLKNTQILFIWFSLTFLLFFFKNKNFPYIFSIFSLIFFVLSTFILYPLTYSISLKELSIKYKILSKSQKYGYAFWDVKPSFLYYSKKKFQELHKNEEVEEYLKKGNFIIIKEKNFNFLPLQLKKKCKIYFKTKRFGEDFYIISISNQSQKGHNKFY